MRRHSESHVRVVARRDALQSVLAELQFSHRPRAPPRSRHHRDPFRLLKRHAHGPGPSSSSSRLRWPSCSRRRCRPRRPAHCLCHAARRFAVARARKRVRQKHQRQPPRHAPDTSAADRNACLKRPATGDRLSRAHPRRHSAERRPLCASHVQRPQTTAALRRVVFQWLWRQQFHEREPARLLHV